MAEILYGDCIEMMQAHSQHGRIADLVLGSPPYPFKGERYDGHRKKWKCEDWAEWMYSVTVAACSACNGYVVWVVNNSTAKGEYHPAVEWLQVLAYERGEGRIVCERPCIWHKNAPPNRRDWFSNDWEFCIAFHSRDVTPHFDRKALGQAPKYSSGGDFRQRDQKGNRRKGGKYPTNPVVCARDVFRVTVGGGHMGSKLACLTEAPYPEKLCEPFIKCCSPRLRCQSCGFVIDSSHDNINLQAVPPDVRALPIGRQNILLPEVLSGESKGSRTVQGVRQANQADTIQREGEVLQSNMRRSVHSAESGIDQGIHDQSKGVRSQAGSRAPASQRRVCDGASAGDGEDDRSIPGTGRSGASQKRKKGGQSSGEPSAPKPIPTQSTSQGSLEADRLSQLWTPDSARYICPACGEATLMPGRVLDPFCGSGTTLKVAEMLGRKAIGIDVRESQVELSTKRMKEVSHVN